MVEVIVKCSSKHLCNELYKIGRVKYCLPLIDSYVLEVCETQLKNLQSLVGESSIFKTVSISAQMNQANLIVKANTAHKYGISGNGITIAVLDTGISSVLDLSMPKDRIIEFKDFLNGEEKSYDDNGHGTHVAATISGSGLLSQGKYCGIAPASNLVGVKVLDSDGLGRSSDVLAGIQWVVDNCERLNIRIINLSVGTNDITESDPMINAVEAAWDRGIVIIVAAGNNGPKEFSISSPGTSRKVITVGASDDYQEVEIGNSSVINYSGRGPTADCIIKPDVLAPGAGIVSCLSNDLSYKRLNILKHRIISDNYLAMSGTSMATPIVSGAVALLLEKEPTLSPNDVKFRLKQSSCNMNFPRNHQGWGLLNIERLLSNS